MRCVFAEPCALGKIRFLNGGGAPDLGVCRLLLRDDRRPVFQGVLNRGEVGLGRAFHPGQRDGGARAGERGAAVAGALLAGKPPVAADLVEFAPLPQSEPLRAAIVPISGIPEVQVALAGVDLGLPRRFRVVPAVHHLHVDNRDSAGALGVREFRRADGAGGGDAEPADAATGVGADFGFPAGADERGVEGNGGEFWRADRRGEPDHRCEPHVAGSRGNRGETPDDSDPISRFDADLWNSNFQFQLEFDRSLQRREVHPDRLQRLRHRRGFHGFPFSGRTRSC